MLPHVEVVFGEKKLIVNTDKTEKTKVTATEDDWHHVNRLGSLLGIEEDLKRRMQLVAVQFGKCNKLWSTKGVPLQTRLRFYNQCLSHPSANV